MIKDVFFQLFDRSNSNSEHIPLPYNKRKKKLGNCWQHFDECTSSNCETQLLTNWKIKEIKDVFILTYEKSDYKI